jgi:16S rRNA C967 or C1407 C5-methylase (RsmB/RsmF family)
VLDTCASPGGKTSQMADLMGNSGIIIANELYWDRHIPLSNTLARLGVLNTVITAYQAQEFPLRTKFHYVLADVPCTGEGRFRMNGGKNRYEYHLKRALLPEIQKRIILRGFDLLEDLGEMVYSTCTYNPEENESVVDYLLQERDAVLLPVNTPFPHEPGLKEWRRRAYDRQLQRAARFYPHQLDSVGFFVARIGRKR